MSKFIVTCEIDNLKGFQAELLEQAGCVVETNLVSLNFITENGEQGDEVTKLGSRLMRRELSRLNALTGQLFKPKSLKIEPPPSAIVINAVTAWSHLPQFPSSHSGWENEGDEHVLSAWDIASKTDDVTLSIVMLDLICELSETNQDWTNENKFPPRFAEVRLIRNLIVHGKEYPKNQVKKYLELFEETIPASRFEGRYKHLELARYRLPHLLLAVWPIVINSCVDEKVELYSEESATLSGAVIYSEGPFPLPRK